MIRHHEYLTAEWMVLLSSPILTGLNCAWQRFGFWRRLSKQVSWGGAEATLHNIHNMYSILLSSHKTLNLIILKYEIFTWYFKFVMLHLINLIYTIHICERKETTLTVLPCKTCKITSWARFSFIKVKKKKEFLAIFCDIISSLFTLFKSLHYL